MLYHANQLDAVAADPPGRLTPLLLALGASLAWGVADFVGPLFSRTLGILRVLFWAQVGGVLAIAHRRRDPRRGAGRLGGAVRDLRGVGGMLGLVAYYRGMQIGVMSVVAPIAGVSAVIPVVFGIATGDNPSPPQIAGIACALVGVGARLGRAPARAAGASPPASGWRCSLRSASASTSRGCTPPGKVDFWWASLIFRTTALPDRRAPRSRRSARRCGSAPRNLAIVVAVGIGDTVGNVLFAASSGHGLVSLTAVLASLYPIVTVLLAAAVLHERVAPMQRAGIVLTLTGVVLISV